MVDEGAASEPILQAVVPFPDGRIAPGWAYSE
jgi:hypothetical protein